MKHLVYILILAAVIVGCEKKSSNPQPQPEIVIDPWIPPYSETPNDEYYKEEYRYYPQDVVYGDRDNDTPDGQQPVPEPNTLLLVGGGVALIEWCRKKKKNKDHSEQF